MACLFGHKWDGCKCKKCGKTRDEQHTWENNKCTVCGKINDEAINLNKTEKPNFIPPVNKNIFIFEAHDYDKVFAASMAGAFPSDEKKRLEFFRQKACAAFNVPNDNNVEYVIKTDWNAPDVKFTGNVHTVNIQSVHIGVLAYFNNIGIKFDDQNKLISVMNGINVSSMPNSGILWLCAKTNL